MRLEEIFVNIEQGNLALPHFQRTYTWQGKHVRALMHSLYRKYPVGGLLTWQTAAEYALVRGDVKASVGGLKLLLDGQQRITTLYGIVNGKAPPWFVDDIDHAPFTRLYFHLEDEIFEYYGRIKMQGDPLWIDVTAFMQSTAGRYMTKLRKQIPEQIEHEETSDKYNDRLNQLEDIKRKDFPVENVINADLNTAINIFNLVNSSGTPLTQGDLAMAKLSGQWPEVREEMQKRLDKWSAKGYQFEMNWLLRCANAIVTGQAMFHFLHEVDIDKFKHGLQRTEDLIDRVLNLIGNHLGLDHWRVLGSPYSIPVMISYLDKYGKDAGHSEHDKLLCWYVHTMLWGWYSASTEADIRRDLVVIENADDPLQGLFDRLRRHRGDLGIAGRDFDGVRIDHRFYRLIYLLTRVTHVRDFENGMALNAQILGKDSRLHLHHIFPKSKLYDYGYEFPIPNAIANMTFLTEMTNLQVSNQDPEEYFEHYENKHPGILESHWIPKDRELWKYENYEQFLEARRELLAETANGFLQQLENGHMEKSGV